MLKLFYKGNTRLSQNFTSKEFECSCCGYALIDTELVTLLERVRSIVAKPIGLARGYSCPRHNTTINGSAVLSRHLMGMAADLLWEGMIHDLADPFFRHSIESLRFDTKLMGVGWGYSKMHVDVDHSRLNFTTWKYT